MIVKKTVYVASNDKVFDTLNEAQACDLDTVRSAIDKILSNELMSNRKLYGLKHHHIQDIVEVLCPNYEDTKGWVRILYNDIFRCPVAYKVEEE